MILFVLGFLCLFCRVNAQDIDTPTALGTVVPLRVGDKVPEGFWTVERKFLVDGQLSTRTLGGYRGKLLIVDFWASWCSSCLIKMPRLDSLQKAMGEVLNVLLVNSYRTGDSAEKVAAAVSGLKARDNGFSLPTVYADSLIYGLSPHQMVPHYLWIGPDERVIAVTGSALVNADAIRLVLSSFVVSKN